MLTLGRRRQREQAASEDDAEASDPEHPGQEERERLVAHAWTNRERLTSMATTGLIWMMCLSGPIALGAHVLGGEEPALAPVEVQDVGNSQGIAAFGTSFMREYLTASKGQEDRITAMLADGVDASLSLPQEPAAVTSVMPGEVEQLSESAWLVTVVVEHSAEDDEAGSVLRYWQVPVQTGEGGHRAVSGLPSLVPSPTRGDLSVEPGDDLNDSEVSEMLGAFMRAYLTGQGEVAPLTAPDSSVTAIAPTPFAEASVGSIRTTQEVPESPSEGDLVRAQVSVSATAADGSTAQLGYTVELRYRDRWEVAAINPTPSTNSTSEGAQS